MDPVEGCENRNNGCADPPVYGIKDIMKEFGERSGTTRSSEPIDTVMDHYEERN